jgi:uncharacterized protein YjeT (DUF2065 family)
VDGLIRGLLAALQVDAPSSVAGHRLAAAEQVELGMRYFLSVIGMVIIVEGLPYFAFPERMKAYLVKMLAIPDQTLRRLGFLLMLAGLVLVFIGRQG